MRVYVCFSIRYNSNQKKYQVTETDLCFTFPWQDTYNLFLCQLAYKGKASAIDHLIQKSPEHLGFRDENGASLLHYASAGGNLDIIRLIVSTVGPEGKTFSSTWF